MIALGIAVVFAVVVGVKLGSAAVKPAVPNSTVASQTASHPASDTLSATRGDALAAYEAALASGQPVYVLFHSMTCQSCIDLSKVIDSLLPEYEGRVVFVNAITDDPGSRALASRFEFQYIPTSFFIDQEGTITDTYVGPLDEAGLRAKLDRLTE